MFIESEELKTVLYSYQLDQITEGDDTIVLMAINAAVDQAKSYLRPNDKKEWLDGRRRYDVDAVFSKTGTDRNALLLEMTKNIAVWFIVRLANVDMLHEQVKDRYDRSISWLKMVNKGEITLDLPVLTIPEGEQPEPFRYGSRKKFNHE